MAIVKCVTKHGFSRCSFCKTILLKDSECFGDYFDGILHSWCDDCGRMYGPDTFGLKELSKRKAHTIAVKIATKHGLNFKITCEIAEDLTPCFDRENFARDFSFNLGNRINRPIPSSEIFSEVLKV